MAVTFPVSDVTRGAEAMRVLPRDPSLRRLLGDPAGREPYDASARFRPPRPPSRRVEALFATDAPLVSATDAHALAQAAHDAFYLHHPLALSPDAVWFCLAQGFAHHIALHAAALRGRFVKHEGKMTLTVVRPDFSLGQPNPWPEAFAAFSDQIAEHVGKLRDLVVADFSTTGPLERAASEVVLMDAFQPYFEYVMMIGCGIPEITLLGTPEDWLSVRRRAAMLSEMGLAWWTDVLLPVLDEVVRTSEGHVDRAFWRSFFRYQSGSGPSELTGWIHVLFPYLKAHGKEGDPLAPNPYLATWERAWRGAEARKDWRMEKVEGPSLGAIPTSLASAPVKLVDLRDGFEHRLRFVAGLLGVVQEPVLRTLMPEFGWAVVHDPT